MKELYLIDASGLLYRAYFAIQGMSSRQGDATNALYGFIRSYLKLQEAFHPTHIAAIFDGPTSKASRVALYSEYKAHRKETPADLIQQIEEAKSFCSYMNIPQITSVGVEADDTIASIAVWAKKEGVKVTICSADKDLMQLVDENVALLHLHKDNLVVDRKKVEEIYGIPPEKIVDYLAIIGDTSDNVPGLSGFGPKSAVQLLHHYGSLEAILDHAHEIGGKKQVILEQEREIALLSKKLVQLNLEAPFPHEASFFLLQEPNIALLQSFYEKKNFSSLLQLLPQKNRETPAHAAYHLVDSLDAITQLVEKLKNQKEICIDTETTNIHPMQASLVGIGLAATDEAAYYIPCNSTLSKREVLEALQPLFESPSLCFFGHNIKYDLHILANEGIDIRNISFDTILASYVLHAERRRHSLDELTYDYFGVTKIATSDLLGKGKNQKRMDEVPIHAISEYCCEDVAYTLKLKKVLQEELSNRNLTSLFHEIELPLIKVLMKMERYGIYVNALFLQELSHEVMQEISRLQEEIFQLAGEVFNLNSPKQLSEILFQKLAIKPPKKGKTMPSTNAEVLEELAAYYPIAQKLLDYRSVEKLRSTYIDSLPETILPKTKRIHCQFNQSVAATGRLSCQDPNLQNIPIRTALGKRIREAFRPQHENWVFVAADYSQIELRLLAHISQDEGLLHAFCENQDIHAYTASLVFNIPQEAVTEEMRRHAKAVNFGIVYGQQAYGLSQELHISIKEADQFIHRYFQRYPRVQSYIQHAIEEAKRTGKATTLTGRERLIPEIHSSNQKLRNAAERLAINTPLQGTAADLIKKAMLHIDQWLSDEKMQTKMVLQIHDELLFEVPDHEVEKLRLGVKERMEQVMQLSVPLIVEIGIGKNWKEC